MKSLFLGVFALFCLTTCQQTTETSTNKSEPQISQLDEVEYELSDNLLKVWYPRTTDEEMGGFLTNFSHDWQQMQNQDKMIVTQARHLWTLSKAAAMYPEETLYAESARHAYEFLSKKMWDDENGGFYWLVSRNGEPIFDGAHNAVKRVYGNAFGIYALAAYYAMSGEEAALNDAQEAFHWLEEHAHDDELGGYFPTLTQGGQPIDSSMFESDFPMVSYFYKDQNTSIHVLEALTELFHVWPDELLEERLREMFHLVRDRMVSEEGYLRLFFYDDWQPVSYRDSTLEAREANYGLDHVSFGHDIETAYLLLEASEALEEYEYAETLAKAKQMVDHTLRWGFDPEKSGIYDRGYYVPGTDSVEIILNHKNWWSQSEGLNSLFLFSTFYPQETRYREEFDQLWDYTKNYVIDHEHGGWHSLGLDTQPEAAENQKASPWKGNYHNARALMNLRRMMNEESF